MFRLEDGLALHVQSFESPMYDTIIGYWMCIIHPHWIEKSIDTKLDGLTLVLFHAQNVAVCELHAKCLLRGIYRLSTQL